MWNYWPSQPLWGVQDGVTHSGLDLLTSISNQENAPKTCLQVNLIKPILQLKFYEATLDDVKLATEIHQHKTPTLLFV